MAPATTAQPLVRPSADLLERAHADHAKGHALAALSGYERAIGHDDKLANDPEIRANVAAIASGKHPVAAVVALEVLASRLSPPAHAVIVEQASRGKLLDVRHRALAIAARDGFAADVDRVDSYLLDLKQSKTCGDRRSAIEKLQVLAERRAIESIRQAGKKYSCVAREASAAIARLQDAS